MLVKKINEDFKGAMKAKDKIKTSTLSFLRSELNYYAIDKKKKAEDLEDKDVTAVIKRLIKQRNDSIEQFKKGNRHDLVEKETKELEILKGYLPEELSPDELKKIIEEIIVSLNACSIKDMGRVMKELVSKTEGRADNSLLSQFVKERLSPQSSNE